MGAQVTEVTGNVNSGGFLKPVYGVGFGIQVQMQTFESYFYPARILKRIRQWVRKTTSRWCLPILLLS